MLVQFALALPLLAQDPAAGAAPAGPQGPAPELRKYEPMLGVWDGKGTVVMAPGGPALGWTMKMSIRKTLGGHFLEEEGVVSFTDGSMPPMQGQALYGFDREQKRYVVIGANTYFGVVLREIHWGSAGEIIVVSTGFQEGTPFSDREVMRFRNDSMEFAIDRSLGVRPTFTHVQGSFRRSAAQPAAAARADGAVAAPAVMPNGELAKLARLLGRWRVAGTMIPAPGAPGMRISGTETNTLEFGGNVIVSHVDGDPSSEMGGMRYESIGFVAWNANRNCFEYGFADSMGMSGLIDGRMTGSDEIVYTCSAPYMGTPSTNRMVQRFTGDAKHPIEIVSDRLHGAAPVVRDFEAKYSPAK